MAARNGRVTLGVFARTNSALSRTGARRQASQMDWSTWTPRERANLCFILKDQRLLLIRKKRGIGAGKVNAPGGKIEPGETAMDSAVRETQEEIGVTPLGVTERGELSFDFADGYSLHCVVFMAEDFVGEPVETEEAAPFWVSVDAVPYAEMWEDDRHWLPLMLKGKRFDGFFEFDGDKMTSNELTIRTEYVGT